jgi:hypothetical protein
MATDFEAELSRDIRKRARFIGPRFLQFPDALDRFVELGTSHLGHRPSDPVPEDRNRELIADVRSWMSQVIGGAHETAAFTDGTTLSNVNLVLKSGSLSHPELLYDLATFVEGAVLFDRIFHLGNPRLEDDVVYGINEALGGDPLIVSLKIDWENRDPNWGGTSPLRSFLTGLWAEVAAYFTELQKATATHLTHDAANTIRASWEVLLGVPLPDTASLFAYLDAHFDSPVNDLAAQAADVLRPEARSFGYQSTSSNPRVAYLLANESNQRSRFNMRLADELGLPYLQSWARLPYRHFYEAQAFRAQNFLATADFLEHEYRSRAASFMHSRVTMQLPFFLSAVLSRISRLGEFFEELGHLRHKTAKLRTRRAELDQHLHEGDKHEVDKLKAALAGEAREVVNVSGKVAIAAISSSIVALGAAHLGFGGAESLALPGFLAFTLAEGAAHLGVDEAITKASERILKPEFSILADVSDAADGLTNALPQVGRLWRVSDDHLSQFDSRFRRLAELRPGV